MSRLLDLLSKTFTRFGHRTGPHGDFMDVGPLNDYDPLRTYAQVLAEARERRGRLVSRR